MSLAISAPRCFCFPLHSLLLYTISLTGCGGSGGGSGGATPHGALSQTAAANADTGPWFEEVTTARGLPPPTVGWPDGTLASPEITSGGVALFDYDNDGRLDILQICHGRPGRFDESVANRLFHQEPDGTFREI